MINSRWEAENNADSAVNNAAFHTSGRLKKGWMSDLAKDISPEGFRTLAHIFHLFSLITDRSRCQAVSASENTLNASSTEINLNRWHVSYVWSETPVVPRRGGGNCEVSLRPPELNLNLTRPSEITRPPACSRVFYQRQQAGGERKP